MVFYTLQRWYGCRRQITCECDDSRSQHTHGNMHHVCHAYQAEHGPQLCREPTGSSLRLPKSLIGVSKKQQRLVVVGHQLQQLLEVLDRLKRGSGGCRVTKGG